MGWGGKFIGGGAEKAGNIAFLTIVACFIVIAVICLRVNWATDADTAIKVVAGIVSIITLALGYLFGVHRSASGPDGGS